MNDVFQIKTHLHFGAVIHISCFMNSTNFYMFSNGISFKYVISMSESEGPIDPYKCLFTITPVVKFQSEGFLQKILNSRYQDDSNDSNEVEQYDEKKAKIFIDQFEFELKQNNKLKQQQHRYPIKYNENFMLQHKFSSKYLSFVKNSETNEYSLQLSQIPTSKSIFNLKACFNYQKDINTYIPFNSAAFLNVKIHEGLHIRQMNLSYTLNSIFESWMLTEEGQSQIKFGLYETGEEVQFKSIKFGDSVWIFHLESGSFVKVVDENRSCESLLMKNIKYTLGYMLDKQEQRKENAKIIIQKVENEMSAEKFGIWKIVSAASKESQQLHGHGERFIGGRVKFDQEIRFFNVRYQAYLSVRQIKKARNKFEFQFCMEQTEEENTIFKIKCLSSNSAYATTEDLFLIQNVLTNTYMTLEEPLAINSTQAPLSPSGTYKKQDNFKMTKIDFLQEWQNSYILNILPFINQGIFALKSCNNGLISHKNEVMLKLMSENLIQLLTFSYDLTEGFEASESKLGKMTYNHFLIQKLLREQGVIQKLIEILDVVNPNILLEDLDTTSNQPIKMIEITKIIKKYSVGLKQGDRREFKMERSLFLNIINTSFKILRNCCKSNSENSEILFTKFEVFIKYLSLGTYAEVFFMDSFHNVYILEKITYLHFKSIIKQYVNIFQQTRKFSPSLFKLLGSMIKIDNQSIGKNQLEIFKLLFTENNQLIIPIKPVDNRFLVGQGIELNDFCEGNKSLANYLAAQIKFCGCLTSDRNYVCSKTIKQIFPISTIYFYFIDNPKTLEQIKESLLQILINSYLNQRPRFKETNPMVFGFDHKEIDEKTSNFDIQIRLMRAQGLSEEGIEDILSCIKETDSMSPKQLQMLKVTVIKQIEEIVNEGKSQQFYSSKMESYMICLKYLIELSVFKKEESREVEKLIKKIAEKIAKSLLSMNNENQFKLESTNFRELLLEMVEKNVIKKFNYSVKFDGIEDEVEEDNICSIFVNYSFYQNILLEEKDPKKRKETDLVMKIILELIEIYSNMIAEEKVKIFIDELIVRQKVEKRKDSKTEFISEIIVDKILDIKSKDKTNIFNLLILLFYNSNTYIINYISLNRLLQQIFSDRISLSKLSHVLFNVDEKENYQFDRFFKAYKKIKLLIETSEIWLNMNEIVKNASSKYDAIIMLFINEMKVILKIVMPGFDENCKDFLYCTKYAKTINPEKQQMLSNLNIEADVMNFMSCYRLVLQEIRQQKMKGFNMLLTSLFKCCFLFLYVFIFDCSENKAKIHDTVKESYLKDYFAFMANVELGETMFLIEFLKNNYEECIEFLGKNPDVVHKHRQYSGTHSKLLLTMLRFYDEPIIANLRKFFVTIFDFSSFKNFIWLKSGTNELNIDIRAMSEDTKSEPLIYHINALEILIQIVNYVQQSRNTIRNHIRKSLSQQYLFSLLALDDFYTKEVSNKAYLRVMVHFKEKIMKIIQFAYFENQVRNDELVFNELRRENNLLNKLIEEAPARQENEDFRKIILLKEIREDNSEQYINVRVQQTYENLIQSTNKSGHILEVYLKSIDQFCKKYQSTIKNSESRQLQKMVVACDDIHNKVITIYNILHRINSKGEIEDSEANNYPVPFQWLFSINAANRDEESLLRKKYVSSLIIESMFNKQIFLKFEENQSELIRQFIRILEDINLRQFLFLRKLSQFIEDAFEKLSNNGSAEGYRCLKMLIRFLTIWLRATPPEKVDELRSQIGKSELIFPMLNFFETCQLDKSNKQLFLICLQFFNQLIGEEGNRTIQTIFNQYFTNKADSIEFFMKIKQLFDEINFEDRANYKCKKIYDGIQEYSRDTRLEKQPEFILLSFLICLCKGNFRSNQIFLSSLSNSSNFNIMSGIWQILKYQSQKYNKNLINVENYHLITQCFSTIRELVEGPCEENQNEFLKRDFFLTVLDFFQFVAVETDLTLESTLEVKIEQMKKISPVFTRQLRVYLNRDKITHSWMPSQVKYRCINLICSLLSENVTEESKNQLYVLPYTLIIKELDQIYQRYVDLNLSYTYDNLEVHDQSEVVLPLGFKLYELLQYYPAEKLPLHSPGLDFFKKKSRTVEVLHHKLCTVIFPTIPDKISDAFKAKFLEEVDRTSVNSKLRGLQDAEVQNRQSDYPYGYLLFVTILTIAILDIFIYNSVALPFVQYFKFYFILRGYGVNEAEEVSSFTLLAVSIVLGIIFFILQMRGAVYFRQQLSLIRQSELPFREKFKVGFKFVWQNLSYFHYLLVVVLCLLALFNPFFDALLLMLELYRRSETFSAIINAIGSTLDQLLVVLLFTLVITYILTTITYYYSAASSFPTECSTLYYCFVFSLDDGFRADAGIAGYNDDSDTILVDYVTAKFENVLMNFIYLFLIKVIIDQIIGAIMVDKFAELRESKEKIQEDQESSCFICGLGRNLLDREEDGFDLHKQEYHNIWNYFEFLIYLRKSKISNFSGIELFVYEQQKNGRLNWFPVNRSLHLEMKSSEGGDQNSEENEFETAMKTLDLEVNVLRDEISEIWDLFNIHLARQKVALQ